MTLLAGTMALGVTAIAAILWLRLSEPPLPALPANLALPAGTAPAAVTFARDWIVVVTDAGAVLLYDRAGALRDTLQP